MRMWGTKGQVLMQLLHFLFALGGLISPLISAPFLSHRDDMNVITADNATTTMTTVAVNGTRSLGTVHPVIHQNTFNADTSRTNLSHLWNVSVSPYYVMLYNTSNTTALFPQTTIQTSSKENQNGAVDGMSYIDASVAIVQNQTVTSANNATILSKEAVPRQTNVHYAFLITGVLTCVTSLLFFTMYAVENKQSSNIAASSQKNVNSSDKNQTANVNYSTKEVHSDCITYRQLPRHMHCIAIAVLCLFYLFYSGIEDTFSSLLMTFLVREYDDISKSHAAHILAIFWSSFASSRFLMIFLAQRLSPVRLLTSSTACMLMSIVAFTLVAELHQISVLTIVSGLVGFSMSGIFASGFSWCESEYMRVTSAISACILVFCVTGSMLNPQLIVRIMEHYGSRWFCYIFLIETFLFVLIFTFLMLFNRNFLNKNYGPLRSRCSRTMQQSVKDNTLSKESDGASKALV